MSRALITVNGAILERGTSGSARVTEHLLDALGRLPGTQVTVARPRAARSRSSAANAVRDGVWDLHGAAHRGPRQALHISPCNIGRGRRGARHLLVVHDVMVLDDPSHFDPKFARYFSLLMPLSLRMSDRVMTTSERTRRRLLQIRPSADIHVVPLPASRPVAAPRPVPSMRTALMVGATEPHKNHVAGIRAVALVRRRTGVPLHLRLVGPPGRAEDIVRAELAACDPDGDWTSREVGRTDAEVAAAYDSSWVLLQPSIDEGFGLPLVEAAAAGLPVVHSGRGAMPGILPWAGAGGITADSLVSPLLALLEDDEWRDQSRRVRGRAQDFTPAQFVSAIHALVRPLLGSRADADHVLEDPPA